MVSAHEGVQGGPREIVASLSDAGHHRLTLHHFRWARKVIRLANGYAEALQSSRWLSLQIRFEICRYTTATSCTPRGSFTPTALHALFRRAMTAVASVREDVSMLVHWVTYDYTFCVSHSRRVKQIADTLRFHTDNNDAPTTPKTPIGFVGHVKSSVWLWWPSCFCRR